MSEVEKLRRQLFWAFFLVGTTTAALALYIFLIDIMQYAPRGVPLVVFIAFLAQFVVTLSMFAPTSNDRGAKLKSGLRQRLERPLALSRCAGGLRHVTLRTLPLNP